MCVCLAFLWHVCFPPKKKSVICQTWKLTTGHSRDPVRCGMSGHTILLDMENPVGSRWKNVDCWWWMEILMLKVNKLSILFYMSFNVVLQSSCFLRMGIPVFFIQEWWMVMFPRTQFFVKLGRQNLPSVGTWEFWHLSLRISSGQLEIEIPLVVEHPQQWKPSSSSSSSSSPSSSSCALSALSNLLIF